MEKHSKFATATFSKMEPYKFRSRTFYTAIWGSLTRIVKTFDPSRGSKILWTTEFVRENLSKLQNCYETVFALTLMEINEFHFTKFIYFSLLFWLKNF